MDFKAARLCVNDQSFLNFSWSCPEVPNTGSTSNGEGDGAPGDSKPQEVEEESQQTSQEDPSDPREARNAGKEKETGFMEKISSWVYGNSSTNKSIEVPKNCKRHYVFVVDCSGSMSDTPIEVVQETLISFFEMLQPTDLLSVVTFSNSANLVFHCRTQADSAELNASVQQIRAGGGTNLCSGLVEGIKAMEPSHSSSREIQNVMVLLSDGCANIGITSPASISAEIQADADRLEAVVYSIGIGHSYNNNLLQEITTNFSGMHYHLDSSENIPYVIGNIIGDIQPILFKDVTLTLLLPPQCVKEIQSPTHLTCQKNSNGVEIRMRSLRARDSHNVNLRLNDAEVSRLPNPLPVQVQAKSAAAGVFEVTKKDVDVFDVEDTNPEHDIYRSNLARMLFVEGTKGNSGDHSVERLEELRGTLAKLPRASENATVTSVVDDLDDLVNGLRNHDLGASYDYICSNAQNMHSKARGLKSKGGACLSAYESPVQAASSATMSAKVRFKRANKRQTSGTISGPPNMARPQAPRKPPRNGSAAAQTAVWGFAPPFHDEQQHTQNYEPFGAAIQQQECQFLEESPEQADEDMESPEDQRSV
eukprot:gb/GECG01015300.1/.p1 GENE.gb/GECG01015300.1/~~gb/GECG01015300.1/.p1  ORF type:complete len:591 (+),score=82.38 gb/GECG01015300.1/:1-1773(+)